MNIKKRLFIFFLINLSCLFTAILLVKFRSFVAGTALEIITHCQTHSLFGIYCPLCGGTRALGSLMAGDILSAIKYNVGLVLAIPCFIYYDVKVFVSILKNKDKVLRINKIVLISLGSVFILNFIIKNVFLLFFNVDFMI